MYELFIIADSTVDDDSLCDDVTCPANRECIVMDSNDGMSGRAVCACIRCDDVTVESPVCGSDGTTYYSMCHLNRKSCITGEDILPIRHSKCGRFPRVCRCDAL